MSTPDWIILVFLAFSVAVAAIHGFFFEVFKLAGWIVGYILAAWQYHRLALVLVPYVQTRWVGELVAFLVIFFAVLFIAGLVGRTARWMMKKASLSGVDRVLGGLLGFVRGVLVLAIILTAIAAFAPGNRWLAESQLAPYLLVGGRAAIWLAPSELRQRFYRGLDYARRNDYSADGLRRELQAPK
jgi:membrane protein required for colicin V production